jgi:hypothetical protein
MLGCPSNPVLPSLLHSCVPRCRAAAVPACCQEQLAGLTMINPEEFMQGLSAGVRARVEALQVRIFGLNLLLVVYCLD